MRLFDIFSRHPRDDISAHADGELAPERRDALEAHIAGCERCRTELDELLAVRSALRGLPQVAAPRSFALTPAMAEGEPRPVTPRTTPAFVAMRLAGAGFAAVLAVVVMLDAGGIVDDNGDRSSDESSTALFDADPTNRDADATDVAAGDAAPDISDGDIGALAATPPLGDDSIPAAGEAGGGVQPPNGPEDAQGSRNGDDGEATAPEPGEGAPAAFTSEDDGVSSLLVIEIGLAAIAVLAIGGSFVVRRRAESE